MRQGTIITAPPVGEPVSLDQAKAQLRIELDDTDQDVHVTGLIRDARFKVEKDLGIPILRQTRQTHLTRFPCGPVWLAAAEAITVDQVRYYDSAGTLQTLAPTDYVVDAVSRPAQIFAAPLKAWPSVLERPSGVQITWTGGWADAAQVDGDLVRAMLLLIGHWDQNREAVVAGTTSTEVQLAYDALIGGNSIQFLA